MDKNYYEILEVDKNASPEIIKKAYTTLAKKYHPDLQEGNLKAIYENKLKLINEAYEILSDPEKKEKYDSSLQSKESSNANYNTQQSSNNNQSEFIREQQEEIAYQEQLQREIQYRKEIEKARQQAYYDAYIQDLKNRGYKIRYKKTFKDYLTIFITIIAIVFILYILWQIPFIKNHLVNLYNSNSVVHFIVDIFINSFRAIFNKT